MGKKITFLPFINGSQNKSDGKQWRIKLENDFLNDSKIIGFTKAINEKRRRSLDEYATKDELIRYHLELHELKKQRQIEWIKKLVSETANLFEAALKDIPDAKAEDRIIVAALPEFFWCDINDNRKHEWGNRNSSYIKGYHKPLYDDIVSRYLFHAKDNPLAELTKEYQNLIIFAGTAMDKKINYSDHKEDKIYNILPIFYGGNDAIQWLKCYFSHIDGFDSEEKEGKKGDNKVLNGSGELETNPDLFPITKFRGVKFTYDICRDFIVGKKGAPLSTVLCEGWITDVNVLIAAGMGMKSEKSHPELINSPVLLRCDGLTPPYAQIVYKNGDPSIDSMGVGIDRMEIEIDVADAQDVFVQAGKGEDDDDNKEQPDKGN